MKANLGRKKKKRGLALHNYNLRGLERGGGSGWGAENRINGKVGKSQMFPIAT